MQNKRHLHRNGQVCVAVPPSAQVRGGAACSLASVLRHYHHYCYHDDYDYYYYDYDYYYYYYYYYSINAASYGRTLPIPGSCWSTPLIHYQHRPDHYHRQPLPPYIHHVIFTKHQPSTHRLHQPGASLPPTRRCLLHPSTHA